MRQKRVKKKPRNKFRIILVLENPQKLATQQRCGNQLSCFVTQVRAHVRLGRSSGRRRKKWLLGKEYSQPEVSSFGHEDHRFGSSNPQTWMAGLPVRSENLEKNSGFESRNRVEPQILFNRVVVSVLERGGTRLPKKNTRFTRS